MFVYSIFLYRFPRLSIFIWAKIGILLTQICVTIRPDHVFAGFIHIMRSGRSFPRQGKFLFPGVPGLPERCCVDCPVRLNRSVICSYALFRIPGCRMESHISNGIGVILLLNRKQSFACNAFCLIIHIGDFIH